MRTIGLMMAIALAGNERTSAAQSISLLQIVVYLSDHPQVPSEPLQGKSVSPNSLGVAPATKETRGMLAYAFYRPIEKFGLATWTDVATLLGHVIAHEMGHLLLPHSSHTPMGLMRRDWDRTQLDAAARHQLTFSREQARLIRARASNYQRFSTGTQSVSIFEPVE